jgi:hypothetical protein
MKRVPRLKGLDDSAESVADELAHKAPQPQVLSCFAGIIRSTGFPPSRESRITGIGDELIFKEWR